MASKWPSGQQSLFSYVKRQKQSTDDSTSTASTSMDWAPTAPSTQSQSVSTEIATVSMVFSRSTIHTSQQPPSDLASGRNEKPVQPSPLTVRFPPTLVGSKRRYFNPDWFKTYSWLEYSVERDATFCFPCRHFGSKSGRAGDTFTNEGFRDWKHATGKEGFSQAMLVVLHTFRQ